MSAEQQYIDLYRQSGELICRNSAEVMNACRDEAFAAFAQHGFPARKSEEYKYTDVAEAFAPDYGLNLSRLDIPVNPYDVFSCDVPNLSTSLYFVVNDVFYDKVQPTASLPQGVIIMSLREAAQKHRDLVEAHYGKLADKADGLVNFNTLFAQDGVFIYVPDGVSVVKPVQIVNVLRSDVDLMANRRMLVVMGKCSSLKLLVCDHVMDNVRFISTQVTEAFVDDNASLSLYELEETHTATKRFSNLYVEQMRDSRVALSNITLHNGATRNTTRVRLVGQGAQIDLSGAAIADKNQRVDNNTFVDHIAPQCTSNELYKYVLDDDAVGAFAGLVTVRPGTQKTTSRQTNRNLCATRTARMYTQPQLIINADDVKCSHGATVGQLDDNALFYMRARGISLKEARLLLMFAFVGEVIDAIDLEALRDRLHMLIEKRFRGELGSCQGCALCK
jgi:Fe-S cluster assembly protein SufD